MINTLKNLFSNQITLEDNGQFYYSVTPYELTNALGNIIAILQQYNFIKESDNNARFSYKLYRTKEGNWYDIEEVNDAGNINILRKLKLAIDSHEKVNV